MKWFTVLSLCCLTVACGASEKTTTTAPTVVDETAAQNVVSTPPVHDEETQAPVRIGPAPAADFLVRVDEQRQVHPSLRIKSGGAKIASKITVEVLDGSNYKALSSSMSFRTSCDEPAVDCQEYVGGAELRPIPWNGFVGEGQCECDRCGAVDATKTYRLVAYSCAGHPIASEPFQLN